MLKRLSMVGPLLMQTIYYESVNPGQIKVRYFSRIEIPPLTENEEITIPFIFNSPLSQAENTTVFSLSYDGEVMSAFTVKPGMQMLGELKIPQGKIKNKEAELLFLAEASGITTRAKFQVHTSKKETININEYLKEEHIQTIENVIVGLDDKGKSYQKNEYFTWHFNENTQAETCYIFDLSQYQFSYEGNAEDIEDAEVEFFLYGTLDDFPRLYFDDERSGYAFKAQIKKAENYYFSFDETFFVDEKTHMISRASGDYFLETSYLHCSQELRERKKSFPFQITMKNIGLEKMTLVYDGVYEFLYEPYGNFDESVYYLLEEESQERVKKEWEEW